MKEKAKQDFINEYCDQEICIDCGSRLDCSKIETKEFGNCLPTMDIVAAIEKAFDSAIDFANTWYLVKHSNSNDVKKLGEVLIKDKNGKTELAKLVFYKSNFVWEIKNPLTRIDRDNITHFKPINV